MNIRRALLIHLIAATASVHAASTVPEETLRMAGECTAAADAMADKNRQLSPSMPRSAPNEMMMMRLVISMLEQKSERRFEQEPAFAEAKRRFAEEIATLSAPNAEAPLAKKYAECARWKSQMLQDMARPPSEKKAVP